MATETHTRSAFIAKLLAPLSPDVEQADGGSFGRDYRPDTQAAWHRRMKHVYAAQEYYSWRGMLRAIAFDGTDAAAIASAARDWDVAMTAYRIEVDRQMRIPAPMTGALRWKEKLRTFGGGHPDWEEAIALDRLRWCVA